MGGVVYINIFLSETRNLQISKYLILTVVGGEGGERERQRENKLGIRVGWEGKDSCFLYIFVHFYFVHFILFYKKHVLLL